VAVNLDAMPHVEAAASGSSGRFVQAFWQSTGVSPNASQRVLPDACADFIFNLTDPALPTRNCAAFVGTMTRAIVVPVRRRRDVFGIRFKPGAAWLLYRAPMRALCDGQTALDDIFAGGSALAERLSESEGFAARIALAEAWIETRLRQIDVDDEKLRTIAAINDRLETGAGGIALSALGWNERKLQRFFEAAYGTNPATMRCFWRFEHVRRVLLQEPDVNLATLALDQGFADQAHMAREFQRFAGLSITAWRAENKAA
jgi:AraC-like DNA-binding protein